MIVRNRSSGTAVALPRRRAGPVRGADGARARLQRRQAARRRRRHDRRRLARPDRAAGRRLDADLPGQRGRRAPGVVRRLPRIKAGAQVPVGRWDADGAPDSLFRSGKRIALYPGNGPGGFIGATPLKLNVKRYDWMVGVGDMGVNGHSGVVVREKKTGYLWLLPGTTQRVLVPGLPGAGVQGVRPGRLSDPSSAPVAEAARAPLGGEHSGHVLVCGVGAGPRRARRSRRPPAAR